MQFCIVLSSTVRRKLVKGLRTPSTASGPPPSRGRLISALSVLCLITSSLHHSITPSLRSTTPSTARREPPKLGKLTSGNPKARSPFPGGEGSFFLHSPQRWRLVNFSLFIIHHSSFTNPFFVARVGFRGVFPWLLIHFYQ